MLAKILEDMWVEPEVLEALSEEQKRILFLKMREEQIRRWRVREEREEGERGESNDAGPKKASSKHVRWLLGRDGDVSVIVIGEVDEFRSSKLLQSLMNHRITKRHRTTSHPRKTPAAPDDDLKDPAEDSDSESGGSADNLSNWDPLCRPHLSRHGNQAPLKARLSDTESAGLQDRGVVCREEQESERRSRVAQLRKAFADDHHNTTPARSKPPIPAKPAHLQKRSTPLIH
uniref:SH2 domain-containing protein 4A-like n=1 Tax=Scophthalmus maximus TaxID=52904 RepID=A0A8D3CBQ7_SCOMX